MTSRTVRRGTDSENKAQNSLFQVGRFPEAHGLYDPEFEHDSCGVGYVAHIKGKRSHQIVVDADEMLRHMTPSTPVQAVLFSPKTPLRHTRQPE